MLRFLFIPLLFFSSVQGQNFSVSGGSFIVSGQRVEPARIIPEVVPPVAVQPKQIPSGGEWPGWGDVGEVSKPIQANPPNRYIMWPGWGRIDLATYNRNCNCGMCQSIRGKQARYQQELRAYQAALAKPKYEPEAVVASQQATPDAVVEQVVNILALTKDDVLADLGCGDGRILIAATKRYGCRGIGIEIEPAIAETARRRVADSGLSDKIQILTGDAVTFDPSSHSVTAITAYLYPELLEKLTPVFKGKTVRVVASPYHQVPGLEMQKTGEVFVYRRPAVQVAVAGTQQYTAEGVCRISSDNAHWSGVVIGPGQILTCGHHQKKGPFKAEFRKGVGFDFVSVECKLVKTDEEMDLSLLSFEVTEKVRPRIYKLRKAKPDRIWGFIRGETAKTFRVFPYDAKIRRKNGYPSLKMRAEGVTVSQHGMSGSPVFAGTDVTAIKWGGDGADVYAVDYDTIQKFLSGEPTPVSMQTGTDPDFELVMFTAKWCGACRNEKNSDRFKKLEAKFRVTPIDVDEHPEWKVARGSRPAVGPLPTFWLVRKGDPAMVESWVGGVDAATVLAAANNNR